MKSSIIPENLVLLTRSEQFWKKSAHICPTLRNINCVDPSNIMSDHDVSITKFKRVLTTLENAKKVLEGDCDSLLELFKQFIMEGPLFFAIRVQRL